MRAHIEHKRRQNAIKKISEINSKQEQKRIEQARRKRRERRAERRKKNNAKSTEMLWKKLK